MTFMDVTPSEMKQKPRGITDVNGKIKNVQILVHFATIMNFEDFDLTV